MMVKPDSNAAAENERILQRATSADGPGVRLHLDGATSGGTRGSHLEQSPGEPPNAEQMRELDA